MDYIKNAISIFPIKELCVKDYNLAINLLTEASELSYLMGNEDDLKLYSKEAIMLSKNILDKVKIYETLILSNNTRKNHADSVNLGIECLKEMGYRINHNPSYFKIISYYLKLRILIIFKGLNSLYNLNYENDLFLRSVLRISILTSKAAYFSNKLNLAVFITFFTMELTIRKGVAVESIYSIVTFGMFEIGKLNNIQRGYKFGLLANHLFGKLPAHNKDYKYIAPYYSIVRQWKIPIKIATIDIEKISEESLNSGDYETYGYNSYALIQNKLIYGENLSKVELEIKNKIVVLENIKANIPKHWLQVILSAVGEIRDGLGKDNTKNLFLSISNLEQLENEDILVKSFVTLYKSILSYMAGDYKKALEFSGCSIIYNERLTAGRNIPQSYFFNGLINIMCFNELPKLKQRVAKKSILLAIKKMKLWSENAPENFLHKYQLLKGEWCRVSGENVDAAKYYDLAIDSANKNGYRHDEALANELASRFFQGVGKEIIAKAYLIEAVNGYRDWGAAGKTLILSKELSDLLNIDDNATTISSIGTPTTHSELGTYSSTSTGLSSLDLSSVIKSTNAISKQTELSNLLAELLNVVSESAASQKCIILLKKNNEWLVEGEKIVGNKSEILKSLPIKGKVPHSLVLYVSRSKKLALLSNPINMPEFLNDEYIQSVQPKSLFAIPLIIKEELSGILYLENKSTLNAFNKKNIDLIKILASQFVVSIDNATYYKKINDLNANYERFIPKVFLSLLGKESILDVKLGDQTRRDLTVMFSDIRSFTHLSEQMTPEENFKFLNKYLSYVVPPIKNKQGFVDRYMGDGIMALFPSGADAAVKASIAILHAVNNFNDYRSQNGQENISIGIGLNSGQVILGTVGEPHRLDGTVISDTVSSASRIEALTKFYQVKLLISEETYNRLKDPYCYALRKVGNSDVQGLDEEVVLYEVFDTDDRLIKALKLQTKSNFEEAVNDYLNKDLEDSRSGFQEVVKVNPDDKTASMYLDLIEKNGSV